MVQVIFLTLSSLLSVVMGMSVQELEFLINLLGFYCQNYFHVT